MWPAEQWIQLWPPSGESVGAAGRIIKYHPVHDVLDVNGTKWSGFVFESFFKEEPHVLTVHRKGDEIICVEGAHNEREDVAAT
jgi:hypothetical protein